MSTTVQSNWKGIRLCTCDPEFRQLDGSHPEDDQAWKCGSCAGAIYHLESAEDRAEAERTW